MKHKIILTALFISFCFPIWSQVEWEHQYGGNSQDRGTCVQNTADGGFIISGSTDTDNNGDVTGYHGGRDVWVVKLNSTGELQWQKAYGGSAADAFDGFTYIMQTSDGGYVVSTDSMSSDGDLTENNGNSDLWVFKIDGSGNMQWQNSLGGNNHDVAYSFLEEADGGLILAGSTSSTNGDITTNRGMTDGWIVKLSATGTLLWQKTVGGTWSDVFSSIQHTTDGGYIVTGSTLSNDYDLAGLNPDGFMGLADFWTVKFDSEFNIEWQNVEGGAGKEYGEYIIQAPDGGYIIAGETGSGATSTWHILKLSSTGTVEWQQGYGGADRDELFSLQKCADNSGFFMVGTSDSTDGTITSNAGEKDVWLLKLSYSNEILINQTFGSTTNDKGHYGVETPDGKIVITGSGYATQFEGSSVTDLLVFKINPNLFLATENFETSEIAVYPNPVINKLHFSESMNTVEVFALNGQKILTTSNTNNIDLSHLLSGTYLVNMTTQNGQMNNKIIVKQ